MLPCLRAKTLMLNVYLTAGAILGGSKGAMDAIRTKPDVAVNSMRLRATQLLNMSGKAGRTRTAYSAISHPCCMLPLNAHL